ncbi:E3 ubiquitin-protein ligase RGLG2 [Glycine soja]|uniref:E3 ubiquitin-protein ligase RGLG2 n=1 Tax=Glycine soja TaxID=3848 RepID=A0A0B2PEZ7_GLYSO|nr:E3 ubiquitin-protein ligase RGLG2 [Glycine soja]
MGGSISKRRRSRQRSASNFLPRYQQPHFPQSQDNGSVGHYGYSSQSYSGGRAPEQVKSLDRKYLRIGDDYKSLKQVTDALAKAGLESSNLIVGFDFTKSNEWTASTHDQEVFCFYPDERFCHGFEEVLERYRELVPQLKLAGPTSFAPVIEMAITIVEQSGGQYHVLVIIADGQVTRSVDTEHGQLSAQEKKTVEAIVKARKETEFALSALMEIPSQYKATLELNILGARRGKDIDRTPLPPPLYGAASFNSPKTSRQNSFRPSAPSSRHDVSTNPPATSASDNQVCPICLTDPKDMAFGCGHQAPSKMSCYKKDSPLNQITITLNINGVNVRSSEGRKGQWQLLLNNTGVVGMHVALTYKDTVIMFDQTGAGQSGYRLRRRFNGSRCTINHHDLLDSTCYAHSVEYDISANKVRPLRLDTDPWCSSASFLSNGTLLQTGGFEKGAKRVRFYRPCGNHQCDWIQSKKTLSDERWYASSQILPEHNRVVVVGGRRVFTYEFVPKTSPGEKSFDLPFLHQTNDRDGGGNNLYPFLHLSSDGNLFVFANRDSILLNLRRNRVIKTFPRIPGEGSRNYPSSGSSVMLPLDHRDNFQKVEVMVCGGSSIGALEAARKGRFLEGLRSCGRMVITGNNNKWEMEYMPKPRLLHDMLILPTGNILIINGAKHGCAGYENARNASLEPYLYSPNKKLGKRFTMLKSTKIARMYHSSATLLSDGRVLVAGGNPHGRYIFHNVAYPTELRLQAFVPHYMESRYHNWRPSNMTIYGGGGSHAIGYGKEFRVEFFLEKRMQNNEVGFSAYAPPFTTHSFAMNQRMLKLRCKSLDRKGGGWVVAVLEAPPSPNVAPSGYYLLTVVNGGIPSMSQWVQFAHA